MKNSVTIYPWLVGYIIFALGAMLTVEDSRTVYQCLSNLFSETDFMAKSFRVILLSFHLGYVYMIIYSFIYAPIRIKDTKLILPRTNYNGIPSGLCWGNVTIDIPCIRKINVFGARANSNYRPSSLGPSRRYSSSQEDKVAIITGDVTVEINTRFYGQDNVNYLVENLWQLNDKIDIADRGL